MSRSTSTESDTKQTIQGCLVSAGILAGLLILVFGTLFACMFGPLVLRHHRVRAKSHYLQCATNLALYYQTYQPFFTLFKCDGWRIGYPSLPQCVAFNPYYYGSIAPAFDGGRDAGIRVGYGGGMDDYGYLVTMTGEPTNGYQHWRCGWFDDNNNYELLTEFDLPTSARLPVNALVPEATSKYLAPKFNGREGVDDWMRGVRFLLMTGSPLAGRLIEQVIAKYPDAEDPRIARALLTAAEGQEVAAIATLGEWVSAAPNTNAMPSFVAFKLSIENSKRGAVAVVAPGDSGVSTIDYARVIAVMREAQKH